MNYQGSDHDFVHYFGVSSPNKVSTNSWAFFPVPAADPKAEPVVLANKSKWSPEQGQHWIWRPFYVAEVEACKENGPQAIWLNEFWCLMINTTCELMCLLVFMFIVQRMRRGLD
jgi:hypothetical protein